MQLHNILIYTVLLVLSTPSLGRAASTVEAQGDFRSFAEKVERETGYIIAYSQSDIRLTVTEFPDITGLTAIEALRKVLPAEEYTLTATGKHIIIHRADRQVPEEDAAAVERARRAITANKIPPRQSVFSGETRLIIIREREQPVDDDIPSETEVSRPPAARKKISGTRIIINSVTAVIPSPEERTTQVREIPFRYDLFESQAFGNAELPKVKKKNRRRDRVSTL